MNGADLVVRMLEGYGIKHVFGVPGETSIPLYSALGARQDNVRHVMARDERSAGFMADAYARVSNRPSVVEFPAGAGPLYGIAAIAESNQSSVPIIAITSDNPLAVERRGFITELDCAALFEPVTKASILLKSANKIPETIRLAFRIATSRRPGVVHLTIPDNVYEEDVDENAVSLHVETECTRIPAYPVRARTNDVIKLRNLIRDAQRPLIVAGAGVNRSGGRAALTAFAERFRAPVVTTMTGQQSISDDHELSIGIIGDNGFHPHANRAMEESDLIVYIGCRVGSVATMVWTFPAPREGRKIVQVDIEPEVLGNNTNNAMSLLADARLLLEDLVNAIGADDDHNNDPNWVATLNGWRATFWEYAVRSSEQLARKAILHPQTVITSLNARLGENQFVYSDPGTPTPYLCRFLKLKGGASRLTLNRAFGGLGYAIPAVVGSWYAQPDVRPIGLFGDGSLGMSAGELETIVRLGVPALLLNFTNSSFAWIEAHKRTSGHENSIALDFFKHVNSAALAESFGMRGITVSTQEELEEALDAALDHDGPVFLDIRVQSIADELPPVYSWLRKSGVDPLLVDGRRLEIEPASGPLRDTG